MTRTRRAAAALLAASALAAGAASVLAGPAAAATTTPPWQTTGTDPDRVGTLTFFDSTGKAVTSGTLSSSPVAAYVQGSKSIRTGDTKAALYAYTPVAGKAPGAWSGEQLSAATTYGPAAGAPSTVSTTLPVVSGQTGDYSLADYIDAYPNTDTSATDGYAGIYELRVRTNAPGNTIGAGYDVADIAVDETAGTWSVVYPSATTTPDASSIAIAASPKALTFGHATAVKALLKDTTSGTAIAGASLVLKQRTSGTAAYTTVGTATTTSGGSASLSVTPGSYRQFAWFYAGSSAHAAAQSAATVVTVSQTVSVAVDHGSVKHGTTVRVYGAVSPAVSGRKVSLQELVGRTWRTVGTAAAQKRQKLPNGRTGVGYVLSVKPARGTYHFRAYAPAASGLGAGYSVSVAVKAS